MNGQPFERFLSETVQAFSFLESEAGYRLIGKGVDDIDVARDAKAFVRYIGSAVGVEVYWGVASAVIGVALVELLAAGEFPSRRRFWGQAHGEARAISLYTLGKRRGWDNDFVLKRIRSTKPMHVKEREREMSLPRKSGQEEKTQYT